MIGLLATSQDMPGQSLWLSAVCAQHLCIIATLKVWPITAFDTADVSDRRKLYNPFSVKQLCNQAYCCVGSVVWCMLSTVLHLMSLTALQAQSAGQVALNTSGAKSMLYQHTGPVHAVHSSPFDASLTVTCGLDGKVRVGNSLTKQALLELCPSDSYLFSGQWSPTKAGLLAVGAGDNSKCMTVAHLLIQLLRYMQMFLQ